jgi:hypothetical protein
MSTSAVNYAEPCPSASLRVARQIVGRRAVLTVSGEVDLASVPILENAVAAARVETLLERMFAG